MTNQKNSNKQEYKILTTLRNILVKNDTKEETILIKKDEYYISEILFAILYEMNKEGYYELSLKSEDIKEYVISIKKLLDDLNISVSLFDTPSIDFCCNELKNFIIKNMYERDYGYYDDEIEVLFFNIDEYTLDYAIEGKEKIKKIIDESIQIIIKQNSNQSQVKKLILQA